MMLTSLQTLDMKLQMLYEMRPFSGSERKPDHSFLWRLRILRRRQGVSEKKKRDEKEMLGHDKALTKLGLLDKLEFAETEIKAKSA